MTNPRYIIGIDLGTTNCSMAYSELSSAEQSEIIQVSIPQINEMGVQIEQTLLPSFLYFPLDAEREAKIGAIDWAPARPFVVGAFAKHRGAEIPNRLISSAKSWLCHDGINRREKILPLDAPSDIEKQSPVSASSAYLKHLKEVWERQMPGIPFNEQTILITTPASFDPSARQLTLEAAALADYPEVTLLEEPQAAFYAWLFRHFSNWREHLKIGDQILVIDIGGGTTDFTLIAVEEDQGQLRLRRLAVGNHLLLGGDNMDMALAYFAEEKLQEQGHNLDEKRFSQLVHLCREAKENLLGNQSIEQYTLTLQGQGSRLIGGSISITLKRDEVQNLLIDGFFPLVQVHERSFSERRAALGQVGLPFTQDPRISSQLAKFLSMTGESDQGGMEKFVMPTTVLFNGGVLKSGKIRDRLFELLNAWAGELNKPTVQVLGEPEYDHAVSLGATYYGLTRVGKGIRVRGGASRSYFIAVEGSRPAIPGLPPKIKTLCVVPYGMEEGTEIEIDRHEFSLLLGETATFRFFSHATPTFSNGTQAIAGEFFSHFQNELKELHPIECLMEKSEADGKTVKVKLKSKVTELGVLELWCHGLDGRKWKLEFDSTRK